MHDRGFITGRVRGRRRALLARPAGHRLTLSVCANWHVPEAPPLTGDPFANLTAKPLNARPSRKALERQLLDLMHEESDLAARGVRCPIKDRPDCVCLACPLRERVRGREPLCRVGVAQERVTMRMATYDERVESTPA